MLSKDAEGTAQSSTESYIIHMHSTKVRVCIYNYKTQYACIFMKCNSNMYLIDNRRTNSVLFFIIELTICTLEGKETL